MLDVGGHFETRRSKLDPIGIEKQSGGVARSEPVASTKQNERDWSAKEDAAHVFTRAQNMLVAQTGSAGQGFVDNHAVTGPIWSCSVQLLRCNGGPFTSLG